jgi:outer membrane protein assembly factor BamA
VDEAEAWRWLAAKFHRFDRQVPQAEPAQQYLARQFEEYLGARLHGQSLIVRIETDLESGRMTLSFRPEHLPRTKAVTYTGNQALPSTALSAVLDPIAGNQDYTDRGFASALELNLRPLYEQLGLYRVHFTPSVQWVEAGAIASVAITEGEPYRLGRVQLIGEELPVDAMLAAVKLPVGKPANWKLIQEGVWAMERVVKRTGYFSASAMPEREFDDGARTLNLRIRVARGPLYHFGELNITGLTPELAGMARRLWKPKPGDAYDFLYGNDFLQAFSRVTDLHNFSKHDVVVKKGATDHVMDITLAFEVR